MEKNNPIIRCRILAILLIFLTASCTQDPLSGPDPGQPVEIIIGPKPAWTSATRTAVDPDNELATNWVEGDKVYIKATFFDDINFTYIEINETATYLGSKWKTDLRWPQGSTTGEFEVHYIGDKQPGGEYFTNVDALRTIVGTTTAGNTVAFGNFVHQGTRLHFPNLKEGNIVHLKGAGFRQYAFSTEYSLSFQFLDATVLQLSVDANSHIHIPVGSGNKEFSLDGTTWHTLNTVINTGYTYTIYTGAGTGGSHKPGDM